MGRESDFEHAPRAVPLRQRLPNAPPLFVGRRDEISRLTAAIERAPTALVWGIGGFGKTALVLHTLHHAFASQVSRSVMVRLRPEASPNVAVLDIVRTLVIARGLGELDLAGLFTDLDDAVTAAIDLAEEGGLWVVLDDLHHCNAVAASALLLGASRYARKSRWIVTSRERPSGEFFAEQGIALGAMASEDLLELAAHVAPQLAEAARTRLVADSNGSPWRLRQALPGSVLPDKDDVLEGLSDQSLALLSVLVVFDAAISEEVLRGVVEIPDPRRLDALERRGFLERSAAGIRLHDAARPLVRARFLAEMPATARRVAEALGASEDALEDPIVALGVLRLNLDAAHWIEARDLLARVYDRLLESGYLPTVVAMLADVDDAELSRLRLRAAVDTRDLEGASLVTEPRGDCVEDRVLWARALMLRGHLVQAADVAKKAFEAAPAEARFGAGIVEAQCAVRFGDEARAAARIATLEPRTRDETALRDAVLSGRLVKAGEFERAAAMADDLARRHRALGTVARRVVGEQLVETFLRAGRLKAARETYRAYACSGSMGPEAGAPAALSLSDLVTQTTLAVQTGALDEARALVGRFAPFAKRSRYLRAHLLRVDIKRRLTAGELGGLDADIDTLASHAIADENGDIYCVSCSYRIWLAQLRARPLGPGDAPVAKAIVSAGQGLIVELARQAHAVRFGEEVPLIGFPVPLFFPVQVRVVVALMAAEHALLSGTPKAALERTRDAAELAVEHEWLPHEADAESLRADIALVTDDDGGIMRAAVALQTVAAAMGSPRFAQEARFYRSVAVRGVPDLLVLEELAAASEVAPVAARRAQALLGGAPLLDAIDRVVLDAVSRRASGIRVESVAGGDASGGTSAPWRPGWGLDDARESAWIVGIGWVPFASRKLFWRILSTIAERGGRATKEELASHAWDAHDYHPLRDDKRMQVAVHKLRALIELDANRPEHLVTTEDGYAFGDRAPVRRLRCR